MHPPETWTETSSDAHARGEAEASVGGRSSDNKNRYYGGWVEKLTKVSLWLPTSG